LKAGRVYTRTASLLPPQMLKKTVSADLIAAGNRAEQEGRIAEACALYRQAIAADPMHPSAHLNLGAALEAKGDLGGAENAYKAVLAFDATNAFANYNLANIAQARGATR